MKRYLKVAAMLAIAAFFASCNKDEENNIAPPRDYAVQYATEKADIEEYMRTHYMTVDADYNVAFDTIINNNHVSIWDQTEYPKQSRTITSNDVVYTVWYLPLREGVGEKPTKADDILISYRGIQLDGTQFDYQPFPQTYLSLRNLIKGWQEIIPMFKEGQYVDTPSPDPASFLNYGAGVMFVPSGLGYYNTSTSSLSPYTTLIFTFKLYDQFSVDTDGDGVHSKYETEARTDLTAFPLGYVDLDDFDTDEDGTPDYLDTDDDNDGFPTRTEINNPATDDPFAWELIPVCNSGKKRHLEKNCSHLGDTSQ